MKRASVMDLAPIRWPDGKAFAFSIFDDTDFASVETLAPVYDFLEALGLRTTKSVWAIAVDRAPAFGGATCDDPEYRRWTQDLQSRGFEIASHGASYTTASREEVRRSLDRFREIYGHDPRALANHSGCEESIYWGSDRVTGLNRTIYNMATRYRRSGTFRGHREGDPLFWGDLCRERVSYVRNFTFADIDTLAACPMMPYHDPDRPFVNEWFASSEGRDVDSFNRRLAPDDQDRLERAGSACVMYTHFASGFYRDGRLDQAFKDRMTRLADKNGWFVPVSQLLDHVRAERGQVVLAGRTRARLERRWLRSKFSVGST